jgi:UDPglucose 6-dehydrogenase
LLHMGENTAYLPRILQAVEEVNYRQKRYLIEKVLAHYQHSIEGKCFAIWGLSFKPKTDDMREAPSIIIIDSLLKYGAKVRAYDPVAMEAAGSIFGDRIEYVSNNYDALNDADGLLIVTEWDEFRRPNWEKMKSLMKSPLIFDGRNIYDPRRMRQMGFTYYGIGRP